MIPARPRTARRHARRAAAEVPALEARQLLTTLTLTADQDPSDYRVTDASVDRIVFAAGATNGSNFGDVKVTHDAGDGAVEVTFAAGASFGHLNLDLDGYGSGSTSYRTGAVTVGDIDGAAATAMRVTIHTGDGHDVLGDVATTAASIDADHAGQITLGLRGGSNRAGDLFAAGGDGDDAGRLYGQASGGLSAGDLSAAGGDGDDAGYLNVQALGGDLSVGNVSAAGGDGRFAGRLSV